MIITTAPYCHTQRGTVMLLSLSPAALVPAVFAFVVPQAGMRWVLSVMAIGFAFLTWLFSSLTVEVNEREACWYFGPGLWKYRIARADIAAINLVRNSWLSGFGIRMAPNWRLYNVSGLDAVELRLKNGMIRQIGTDDAQGLAAALRS